MKVAIWGSYNYGNYGDDVMAIMFALKLKELNCVPVVYRMNKDLAKAYDIQSIDNLDELLNNASFAFIGGGSWLEKRSFGKSYEKDFEEFRIAIEKHQCFCYALSIGGDLSVDPFAMETNRLHLFQSPMFLSASVRLKIDLEVLKTLGKSGEYHPDIVLSVPSVFTHVKEEYHRKKVGLNINQNHVYLAKLINIIIARIYPGITFYYIQSHLPDFNNGYEYKIEKEGSNIKNFSYTSIESFTKFISELDLMISFKLHPGVTALSYGVPFFLLGGFEKTVAFFRSINAGQAIMTFKKIILVLLANRVKTVKKDFNFKLIEEQQEKSKGHFIFLDSLVRKHRE